jgi:hypothetical protein
MPPELYLGAIAVAVLLALIVSLLWPRTVSRRVSRKGADTDQLVIQLSRIADSLEKLVIRLGASAPRVEETPAPVPLSSQKVFAPEAPTPEKPPQAEVAAVGDQQAPPAKPREAHVSLSMFGR